MAALLKMTFHNEMIDLLMEKLDNPDNPDDYATVADTRSTATYATSHVVCFYRKFLNNSRQRELY